MYLNLKQKYPCWLFLCPAATVRATEKRTSFNTRKMIHT